MTSADTSLACCLTTTSSRADAQQIAQSVLERSLAACVQIEGPIESHYEWQGRQHVDEEFRLVIKTTTVAWPKLKQCLQEIHPYDEPQIILLPIVDATDGYLSWVRLQTTGGE